MKKNLYFLLICIIFSLALSGCAFFDQFLKNTPEPTNKISTGEKTSIGEGFLKDDYKIYEPTKCLPEEYLSQLDSDSFVVLNKCFIKDKTSVYYRPYCGQDCVFIKHDKADAGTLENLNNNFLKDKDYVYNIYGHGDKIIIDADRDSFSVLEHNFSIDKTNVYFQDIKITSIGSSTPEVINQNRIKINNETYACASDIFGPICMIYIPEDETPTTTPETGLSDCENAGGKLSNIDECDESKSEWCVISPEEKCYADSLTNGKCPQSPQSPRVLCDIEDENNNKAIDNKPVLLKDLSDDCDSNSDCSTTIYSANSCCYSCPRPLNKDSVNILEKWRKNNCSGFDVKNECPSLECSPPKKSICENNKCQFKEL